MRQKMSNVKAQNSNVKSRTRFTDTDTRINVKAQMTNEIQMSKLKIQMEITDNGHETRTRSSNAVRGRRSAVLMITDTNHGHV